MKDEENVVVAWVKARSKKEWFFAAVAVAIAVSVWQSYFVTQLVV